MPPVITFRFREDVPLAGAGTSAGDAIGLALDSARTSQEQDRILSVEAPFTLTIEDFDRLGVLLCRREADREAHVDEGPVNLSLSETQVQRITTSVTDSLTNRLTSQIQSALQAEVEFGSVTAGGSVTATVERADESTRTIVREVGMELSQTVSQAQDVRILFHAPPCFEVENLYGLCTLITVTGTLTVKQSFDIIRGNDGLFRFAVKDAFTILKIVVESVDASIDPCVRRGNQRAIPDCVPRVADAGLGRGIREPLIEDRPAFPGSDGRELVILRNAVRGTLTRRFADVPAELDTAIGLASSPSSLITVLRRGLRSCQ